MKTFLTALTLLFAASLFNTAATDCTSPPTFGISVLNQEVSLMWYYDQVARACFEFEYGGEGGNGNRYSHYWTCMSECFH